MNDQTMKKIVDTLQAAMRAEHEGNHFYAMAAQVTEDPKGREVFGRLAKEELDHFEFLKAQYNSILETGKPETGRKLGTGPDLSGSNPIFSDAIRSRLKDAHFEMTALAVGMNLEMNAINYYSNARDETDDPVLKTLYDDLAQWESGHYRALSSQQEALKDEYWTQNNFAPF